MARTIPYVYSSEIGNVSKVDWNNLLTYLSNTYSPNTAVIIAPSSSTRNVVQPSSASYIPFTIKGASSQTANLQEWQNSSGTVLSAVDKNGQFVIAVVNAAGATPVDTDVSAWANNTMGIVKGTGGRIFYAFKNSTDVYYVEMTPI